MGSYDDLPDGQQIKVWWCDFVHVKVGNAVPDVGGKSSYAIVLAERGYAIVRDGVFMGVAESEEDLLVETDRAGDLPLFDKWGDVWDGTARNVMGGPYFLNEIIGGEKLCEER